MKWKHILVHVCRQKISQTYERISIKSVGQLGFRPKYNWLKWQSGSRISAIRWLLCFSNLRADWMAEVCPVHMPCSCHCQHRWGTVIWSCSCVWEFLSGCKGVCPNKESPGGQMVRVSPEGHRSRVGGKISKLEGLGLNLIKMSHPHKIDYLYWWCVQKLDIDAVYIYIWDRRENCIETVAHVLYALVISFTSFNFHKTHCKTKRHDLWCYNDLYRAWS